MNRRNFLGAVAVLAAVRRREPAPEQVVVRVGHPVPTLAPPLIAVRYWRHQGGDWAVESNWTKGVAPQPGDIVVFGGTP